MRRVVLILLALLVLAPTAVQAAVWYRCAHDGEARKACCCPSEAKARDRAERDASPALSAGCCCDVTTIEAPKPSVRDSVPIRDAVDIAPPVLATVTVVAPEARPVQTLRRVTIVPVRPPDPIFVRNCALLL